MQILDLKDYPQHIPKLAEWQYQQWWYLNPDESIADRAEEFKTHLTDTLTPSTFIAVDSELMGSASIIESDMDSRPDLSPWLASVFVLPQYRNSGIGSSLVKHVMLSAKQSGLKHLYLFTPDREIFYSRLGWQVLSREEYKLHAVSIMHIDLTNIRS
jgi:N-acetylglutamate synthase-like GNAT family acetyltransferase